MNNKNLGFLFEFYRLAHIYLTNLNILVFFLSSLCCIVSSWANKFFYLWSVYRFSLFLIYKTNLSKANSSINFDALLDLGLGIAKKKRYWVYYWVHEANWTKILRQLQFFCYFFGFSRIPYSFFCKATQNTLAFMAFFCQHRVKVFRCLVTADGLKMRPELHSWCSFL